MSDEDLGELRPAYRTLNTPTRLLGLPVAGWAVLLIAGGLAYGWLAISPLPWRLNFSIIVIGLGAPAGLLIVRDAGTIGPGRLLRAVLGWRARPALVLTPTDERPVTRGGLRLAQPPTDDLPLEDHEAELPWTTQDDEEVAR